MTVDPLACHGHPHPHLPTVRDLTTERDRLLAEVAYWRGMFDRVLLDNTRRHGSLAAARTYYGIGPDRP